MTDYKIVRVHWLDSTAEGGWKPLSAYEDRELITAISVGFELAYDQEKITLLQSIDNKGQGADSITIPAGLVTDRVVIGSFSSD